MGNTGKFWHVSSQSNCVIPPNNCLPYNKGLLINKEYLHFLGLTFMCQNKYLAAMQRNNYSYVDAAVHGSVSAFI
jgi:hypothetical protein